MRIETLTFCHHQIAALWKKENKKQGERTDLTSAGRPAEVDNKLGPTRAEATKFFNACPDGRLTKVSVNPLCDFLLLILANLHPEVRWIISIATSGNAYIFFDVCFPPR